MHEPWLVLVTNSQRTGRIVRSFEEQSIPHFAPRTISDLGRLIWVFPTYVFVKFFSSFHESYFWGVKGVRRVHHLAPDDVNRLERLQSRAVDNIIRNEDELLSRFARGAILEINSGSFQGHRCTFNEKLRGTKCLVTIHCFGRPVQVTVDESSLVEAVVLE